jgi:hypothetical protein
VPYGVLSPAAENVKVKLAARYESLGPKTQLFFTHHQKTVVVDADAGGDMRRVVAFVGGLDITLGRFDTPRHHVMTTLDTAHKDDLYARARGRACAFPAAAPGGFNRLTLALAAHTLLLQLQ